jgi:uroporphyrinogen decarboxylase
VTMSGIKGTGIQIPSPLLSPDEIYTRLPSISTIDSDFVQDKLGHVIDAVKLIRSRMKEEQYDHIPLIGFSATPFTLLFYMIGGSSKTNPTIGIEWLQHYPQPCHDLLQLLSVTIIEYISQQIEAGCHIIQLFEAMGMMLHNDQELFTTMVYPYLVEIGTTIKQRYPHIPLMIFARGACTMANPMLAQATYINDNDITGTTVPVFDVITMDGTVDRTTVRNSLGTSATRTQPITIQGNYNPQELITENNNRSIETVQQSAIQLLHEMGCQNYIVNLGEGLSGKESPELVATFLQTIHEQSQKMISLHQQQEQQQQQGQEKQQQEQPSVMEPEVATVGR